MVGANHVTTPIQKCFLTSRSQQIYITQVEQHASQVVWPVDLAGYIMILSAWNAHNVFECLCTHLAYAQNKLEFH